jgi:chorismate mutase
VGKNNLDSLRKDIAQIDDAMIELLIRRFNLTDEIGRIKKDNNISIENLDVEKKIIERLVLKSDGKLDRKLVVGIYDKIFADSKERQGNI